MSTSEERIIALRMALDGVRPELPAPAIENVITVAEAYLNFIYPAMTGETDIPVSRTVEQDPYAFDKGWNAALDAIEDGGAGFPATATVTTGTVRNYIKSLRK